MANTGRTLWDFATEQRWFRWLVGVVLVCAAVVLFAAGYRLKPDLGLLSQQIATAPEDRKIAAGEGFLTATIVNFPIGDAQTLDVNTAERYTIKKSGIYFVSLNLNLDYVNPLTEGERFPYFACGINAVSSNGGKRQILGDAVFGISCGAAVAAELSEGDVLQVRAGQASGRPRQASGVLSLLLVR